MELSPRWMACTGEMSMSLSFEPLLRGSSSPSNPSCSWENRVRCAIMASSIRETEPLGLASRHPALRTVAFWRESPGPDPYSAATKEPTHEMAANRTGMAGADRLIASDSKGKLGLARSISRRTETTSLLLLFGNQETDRLDKQSQVPSQLSCPAISHCS